MNELNQKLKAIQITREALKKQITPITTKEKQTRTQEKIRQLNIEENKILKTLEKEGMIQ